METQGHTNTICNLQGYSDAPITQQRSKDCPIDVIYCSDPLEANQGGFLSLGRIVGDHRALWFEVNGKKLLGFRKHDIIPPMARNLCLTYPRTINKFNDTLHKRFLKHDIYQKIHYIHNRSIYPLTTHPERVFEILNKLITLLIYAADKNVEEK